MGVEFVLPVIVLGIEKHFGGGAAAQCLHLLSIDGWYEIFFLFAKLEFIHHPCWKEFASVSSLGHLICFTCEYWYSCSSS